MIECTAIPIFSDNYVWVLSNEESKEAYVVDPGAAEPVLDYLATSDLNPIGILITHSHPDHIGGINEFKRVHDIPVYGPKSPNIPQVTQPVKDNAHISLWAGTDAKVISVPGHLPEHLAFFVEGSNIIQPALFCGDALFSSGCGRIFDGTPEEFYHSLTKLSELPATTQVYCAHEYTLANLKFALHIEPNNTALHTKLKDAQSKLSSGNSTVPSNLENEKQTNPFLRCDIDEVRSRVSSLSGKTLTSGEETFAELRKLKDTF